MEKGRVAGDSPEELLYETAGGVVPSAALAGDELRCREGELNTSATSERRAASRRNEREDGPQASNIQQAQHHRVFRFGKQPSSPTIPTMLDSRFRMFDTSAF